MYLADTADELINKSAQINDNNEILEVTWHGTLTHPELGHHPLPIANIFDKASKHSKSSTRTQVLVHLYEDQGQE